MTNLLKYNQISVNNHAIWHGFEGIYWGEKGADLYLRLSNDLRESSKCVCGEIGETFKVPNGQTAKSPQACEYFAGAKEFYIVELEIYKVIRK